MMDQVSHEDTQRARGDLIVKIARSWLGTPYRHQSSCKGAGTDCLGLLRGVWREVIGDEPETVPPYTPDWTEGKGSEVLLAAAERNLVQIPLESASVGDVVVMRMRNDGVAKHVGILAESEDKYASLIHAYSGHGVVESPLTPTWMRRIAGAFRFPYGS